MAVINVTPDRFFAGSRINQDVLLTRVEHALAEGADLIDIGGLSTRPGASEISVDQEVGRILPAIEAIHTAFPSALISIDTYRSTVAEHAIKAGARMINDISGHELDPNIVDVALRHRVPYVLMHMQGMPQTMQDNPQYLDVLTQVLDYLTEKTQLLVDRGLYDVIIDPGFGFGKSIKHNYALLSNLSAFQVIGHPIMVGVSRKSMIYKTLGTTPEHALNGTTALHMVALDQGAGILRVHDVSAAKEALQLWQLLRENRCNSIHS